MKWWLVPALAMLAACSGPDEAASRALIDRFHTALNAGDWPAIDAMLTRSTRNLRPGGATARAFRAVTRRHGKYVDGTPTRITAEDGRTSAVWSARYENGPVTELFVLAEEGGALKIDSYSDAFRP